MSLRELLIDTGLLHENLWFVINRLHGENFSFKFNYEDGMDIYHNDKKILTSDTENTKKTTTTLLRTILVLTQVVSLTFLCIDSVILEYHNVFQNTYLLSCQNIFYFVPQLYFFVFRDLRN